jgi:UDP-glucuronate 4-epimerase
MKVLVTGSDGMVGSNLVNKLQSRGHTVIEFGDDKDILNWDDWCSIEDEDIECIIHLAALAGVRPSFDNPELYYKVNVDGHRNMLEFSETLNDVRVLYASSSNAYEWWGNPYATTKKMNEIQSEDYQAIGMRFHTIFPGRDDMLFKKLQNGECSYINRSHYRDFVHVEDVTDGILILMNNFDVAWMEQRVYDIGTGHATPVEEVAKMAGFTGEYRDENPGGERVHTIANIEALLQLGFTPKRNILHEISNPE